jgi:hypothetical protein
MIFKTDKKSFINSRRLLYIGYSGFLVSILAGKISKGEWFLDIIVYSPVSPRFFDFLAGFGTGFAITTLLLSILIPRFCSTE